MVNVRQLVHEHKELIIQLRRDLHQIPETAFMEKKTSAYLTDYLYKQALDVQTGIAQYGIVGLMETGRPGPTLMIRADMDALPVAERTGLPFASTHKGVMHACGHDAHMAMVLGAVTVFNKIRNELSGKIKFLFQPAEEGPGGAKPMIKAGVMDLPKVDYLCIDALEVGTQVVNALQRIVSRHMNPLEPAVVTIGSFHAGTAFNVIPGEAELSGTTRTFNQDIWNRWKERIEKIISGVCESMGADFELKFEQGYPATINDESIAAVVWRCAEKTVGKDQVIDPGRTMGGEDFAFYLQKSKGCFFALGTGREGCVSVHNPAFDFNEEVLLLGVETYCRVAQELLK